jgi:hypothetical protein
VKEFAPGLTPLLSMAFAGSVIGKVDGPPVGGCAPAAGGVVTGADGGGCDCANAVTAQNWRASPVQASPARRSRFMAIPSSFETLRTRAPPRVEFP